MEHPETPHVFGVIIALWQLISFNIVKRRTQIEQGTIRNAKTEFQAAKRGSQIVQSAVHAAWEHKAATK